MLSGVEKKLRGTMSCPTSTASNVTPITCALSILELSQRELGAESDTLLVSVQCVVASRPFLTSQRDFINRAIFKKATQFLKDGQYIFVSTKGTRILHPFTNLRTLKEAILKNVRIQRMCDSPIPVSQC